jgi:hypothetical protein
MRKVARGPKEGRASHTIHLYGGETDGVMQMNHGERKVSERAHD